MNDQEYLVFLKAREYQNNNQLDECIDLLIQLSKKQNKKAMFELAKIYCNSNDSNLIKKAINIFVLTGENGYIESYYYLGLIFYKLKDYEESYRYFSLADKYPKSNIYLGLIELNGKIKNSSKRKGFLYFVSGSKKKIHECDYLLGICYQNGYGVNISEEKNNYFFSKGMKFNVDIDKLNRELRVFNR